MLDKLVVTEVPARKRNPKRASLVATRGQPTAKSSGLSVLELTVGKQSVNQFCGRAVEVVFCCASTTVEATANV